MAKDWQNVQVNIDGEVMGASLSKCRVFANGTVKENGSVYKLPIKFRTSKHVMFGCTADGRAVVCSLKFTDGEVIGDY